MAAMHASSGTFSSQADIFALVSASAAHCMYYGTLMESSLPKGWDNHIYGWLMDGRVGG